MPKEFELNYQNTKPVDMIYLNNDNDGQILNPHAINTVRQTGHSPINELPSAKY